MIIIIMKKAELALQLMPIILATLESVRSEGSRYEDSPGK
jgi:hypothetical protein